MKVFAVIMAGGVGSRFWPKSRESMPKQFLNIFDGKSLYQHTFERIAPLVTTENIFVVTSRSQKTIASEQLPDLPSKNIIVEPYGRNTAPCIAVAASAISSLTENAVMIVLPADHLISQRDNFIAQLKDAVRLADIHRALVTIGITPTHPETGYGYIHFDSEEISPTLSHGEPLPSSGLPQTLSGNIPLPEYGKGYKVIAFKEKPDYETAVSFLESGNYLWNSGMFVWRVDVILDELKKNLNHFSDFYPMLKYRFGKENFDKAIEEFYSQVDSISIDYAVMEKAKNVLTLRSSFVWSDVGSWDEIYRLSDRDQDGNTYKGNVLGIKSRNNFVWSEDRLIALVEVEGLIIVETKDAVLVCKKDKSQSVKEIVDLLRRKNLQRFI
jgi:mannose-1-phosphate guanylyltransferase